MTGRSAAEVLLSEAQAQATDVDLIGDNLAMLAERPDPVRPLIIGWLGSQLHDVSNRIETIIEAVR